MAGGKGVTVKSAGGDTASKGVIQTVFKDAICTPKGGVGSPAPAQKNK